MIQSTTSICLPYLYVSHSSSLFFYFEAETRTIALIPLIAAFITTDFFLGDSHNAIERKVIDAEEDLEQEEEIEQPLISSSGPESGSPEIEVWSPTETMKRGVNEHQI